MKIKFYLALQGLKIIKNKLLFSNLDILQLCKCGFFQIFEISYSIFSNEYLKNRL